MSRYLRFHAISMKANLGVMSVICAGIFVAGHLFPDKLFVTSYYGMVPFMVTFLSLITASAATTSQLSLALSMGGNRRDYFWALQVVPILYTVYAVAVTVIFQNFSPELIQSNLMLRLDPLWIALTTYVCFFVGTAMGMLTIKHPMFGTLIIALLCGGIGAFVGLNSVKFIVRHNQMPSPSPVIFAISAVAVVAWNVYLKGYITRYSV